MSSAEPVRGPYRVRLPDGRRLSWREFGRPDGTPVVALHGCPVSGLAFGWQSAAAAAAGFRLIAPDRPGCAGSDPLPGRSQATEAEDLTRLGDALGLDRMLLLGWSSGAPYALATAALRADRVAAVALVGANAPPTAAQVAPTLSADQRALYWTCRRTPALARAYLARLLGLAGRNPRRFAGTLERLFRAAPDRRELRGLRAALGDAALAAPFAETTHRGTRWIVEDQRLEWGPWAFRLDEVAVPVHAWHGAADRMVSPVHSRYLAAHVPGARCTLLAGVGHLLGSSTGQVLTELRAEDGGPG